MMSIATDFEKTSSVKTETLIPQLLLFLTLFLLVHHCFSSHVHHPAKCRTCLTEEITVDQVMSGCVTVMVMSDKCAFSEWELRFR